MGELNGRVRIAHFFAFLCLLHPLKSSLTNTEKHKSYHIKDEQLNRDGFKKFMKTEACTFDACKFSRVCNHIHCIRPGWKHIAFLDNRVINAALF